MKKILVVKHVPFEGPGFISSWAASKSIGVDIISSWKDELPDVSDDQGVVIMGGPMSVNDDIVFIKKEMLWVKKLLEKNHKVLGICLGAQIIANALGASVFKGKEPEIGWFPVFLDKSIENEGLKNIFNESELVFHWHGEAFDLPMGANRIFFNDASDCQGFYKGNAAGFQFHMETQIETAKALIENCPEDIEKRGVFIQAKEEILKDNKNFDSINSLMNSFLDWWAFVDK
ncbi:MAG: type 1 glutamine amidotransferase [Desulforegulaceae bacterium]|nr:type 1 glutamine amidotransferase [Desulforegulaceae bacterium]